MTSSRDLQRVGPHLPKRVRSFTMRGRGWAWLLVVAGMLALSPRAHAQSARQRAQARVLAGEALDFFDAGDFETALARFEAADKLYPTTTLKLRVAQCLDKLDRMLEAIDKYREVIAVELTRRNPPSHYEAREAAKKELRKLRGKVPALVIAVRGRGRNRAEVAIDGQPLANDKLGKPQLRNPGHYTVTAKSGKREARKVVRLTRGDNTRVTLRLRLPAGLRPKTAPWSPALWNSGWIVAGVGLTGVIVGSVTGAKVLSDETDLEARCPDRKCLPEHHADARSFDTARTVSTVAIAAGAVTLAVGTVLVVLGRKKRSQSKEAATTTYVEPFWSPPLQSPLGTARAGRLEAGAFAQGTWGIRGRF